MTLSDTIYQALQDAGWTIDPNAKEGGYGAVKQYIHPETGKRFTWLDAVFEQMEREDKQTSGDPSTL